jgi:muconate cycloisomerase
MNHMRFVKLKVERTTTFRPAAGRDELGGEVDIRWMPTRPGRHPRDARLKEMQPYGISAVEQPVAKADFAGLKQVSEAVPIPVIADESLCNEDDAKSLIDLKACRIFNIRLSKCGGPGAATRIRQMAEAAGIFCQLGCHVGKPASLGSDRHFALNRAALILCGGLILPYLLVRMWCPSRWSLMAAGMAFDCPAPV